MKDRISLLIIYYYFPPRGGVAVQRVVKLCKYLPRFGIDVTVLTSGAPYTRFIDDTLEREIPEQVKVIKTGEKTANEGQFGRKNVLIDAFISWVPRALRMAKKIIKERGIDVVLVSSPPHSQQLVGLALKKKLHIPWIADFRDPWTSDSRFMATKGFLRRWTERLVERTVLSNADFVIATCESATDSFRKKLTKDGSEADADSGRFACITNGFDFDDYDYSLRPPDGRLTLTYAGSTGEHISNPSFFLRALRKVLDQEPDMTRKIQVNFVGSSENRIKVQVNDLGLSPVVQFLGNIPHREAVKVMCESHVLLLFELPVQDGRPTLVLPSKIFEYIGARRPIMAMVTDGDSSQIIQRYGRGVVVDPRNLDKMAEQIKRYFELFSRGELQILPPPPPELSRESLAGKFAEIIRKILPQDHVFF